jgi:hypothetical protein
VGVSGRGAEGGRWWCIYLALSGGRRTWVVDTNGRQMAMKSCLGLKIIERVAGVAARTYIHTSSLLVNESSVVHYP